jgi:hypothetical protein
VVYPAHYRDGWKYVASLQQYVVLYTSFFATIIARFFPRVT